MIDKSCRIKRDIVEQDEYEKKNKDALIINYGRAVNSKQEPPLFEDEPTMCRCCPKADHIFFLVLHLKLYSFYSNHFKFSGFFY